MSDMDRDDGRYGRGAFDPVMIDDPDTYDATDEDDDGGTARGWIMLLVVLAVIAGLAGVVYFAYQQGREEGIRTAPPIVRADDGPEKVAPQDPGGMEIPHQDKQIFERITGDGDTGGEGVERLLPPPEEPVAPLAGGGEAAAGAARDGGATAPPVAGAPQDEPAPAPAADAAPAPEPAQEASPSAPAPAPAAPAPAPATGGWVVQVGAFRDEAQADAQWAALQRKHPEILGSAARDVQRADLGDRGIWYRLRAGGYASETAADTACASLKAAGTDCLVRRR